MYPDTTIKPTRRDVLAGTTALALAVAPVGLGRSASASPPLELIQDALPVAPCSMRTVLQGRVLLT